MVHHHPGHQSRDPVYWHSMSYPRRLTAPCIKLVTHRYRRGTMAARYITIGWSRGSGVGVTRRTVLPAYRRLDRSATPGLGWRVEWPARVRHRQPGGQQGVEGGFAHGFGLRWTGR